MKSTLSSARVLPGNKTVQPTMKGDYRCGIKQKAFPVGFHYRVNRGQKKNSLPSVQMEPQRTVRASGCFIRVRGTMSLFDRMITKNDLFYRAGLSNCRINGTITVGVSPLNRNRRHDPKENESKFGSAPNRLTSCELQSPRANPKHAFHQVNGETQQSLHNYVTEIQTRKRS